MRSYAAVALVVIDLYVGGGGVATNILLITVSSKTKKLKLLILFFIEALELFSTKPELHPPPSITLSLL